MAKNANHNNISVVDRCRALAEPIAAELEIELFDVQLLREGGRLILRYVIDSPQGITHQHCEQFSRRIDPLLDEADPIDKAYFLEVSSPGVERPLRNEADYQRFVGNLVYLLVETEETLPSVKKEIAARGPGNAGRRANRNAIIEGRLLAVNDGIIKVRIGAEPEREIPLSSVRLAHLLLEQNGGERKKR